MAKNEWDFVLIWLGTVLMICLTILGFGPSMEFAAWIARQP